MCAAAKLLSLPEAVALRRRLKGEGRTVVLTNGVFDLLHDGHRHYLGHAAKLGDALFVALNSDASTRALKGPERPIEPQERRAAALGRLPEVAAVVVFEGKRLDREIAALAPDVYCKAGDYSLEKLDPGERAALERAGSRIEFMPFLPGHSTSGKIAKLKSEGKL
ncbi:MAG TPA: adenylyltransferase/cytidyltransferase family protein [Opitutaceae bacterium]|nr:adenylyltransferase/cytidyltransferase family protein [Opitutaceae bacterium]